MGSGNFEGKGMPQQRARRHCDANCAKTAKPIEMPFVLWTWVGARKHVLDAAQIPHAKGQLSGEKQTNRPEPS